MQRRRAVGRGGARGPRSELDDLSGRLRRARVDRRPERLAQLRRRRAVGAKDVGTGGSERVEVLAEGARRAGARRDRHRVAVDRRCVAAAGEGAEEEAGLGGGVHRRRQPARAAAGGVGERGVGAVCEEGVDDGGAAEAEGEVEGRFATAVHRFAEEAAAVGARRLEERGDRRRRAAEDGGVERRPPAAVDLAQSRALGRQEGGEAGRRAVVDGDVERRRLVGAIVGVEAGAAADEEADDRAVGGAAHGGDQRPRRALCAVDRRAEIEERPRALELAAARRARERAVAERVGRLERRAPRRGAVAVEDGAHELDVAGGGGGVQRRVAVGVAADDGVGLLGGEEAPIATWPARAAACTAVSAAASSDGASARAPCASRIFAHSRRPWRAAWCSGRSPSPSAIVADSPRCSSRRSRDGDPATTARHTLSGGCCDEFLGASAGRGETDGAGLEICAVSIAAAQSGARLAGGAGNENSSDGARCADFGWAVARRALTARAGVRMSTVILAAVCHEM